MEGNSTDGESPPSPFGLRRAPAFVKSPACQPKPWRRLVEAAGVEPASEMARHDKTTCVSSSESQLRALNRQETTEPSLIDLGLLPQTEALGLSCKMTLTR